MEAEERAMEETVEQVGRRVVVEVVAVAVRAVACTRSRSTPCGDRTRSYRRSRLTPPQLCTTATRMQRTLPSPRSTMQSRPQPPLAVTSASRRQTLLTCTRSLRMLRRPCSSARRRCAHPRQCSADQSPANRTRGCTRRPSMRTDAEVHAAEAARWVAKELYALERQAPTPPSLGMFSIPIRKL